MIRVALVKNVFEPARGRREFAEPWREGVTARAFLPPEWAPEGVAVFDGPQRVDLDAPLGDGARIVLAQTPGLDPGTLLIYAGVLFVSGAILRSLAPKPPRARGDESSPTHGFSGIQSNRTEGEPIPPYYGKRIVGGQIVAEFIENKGALGSFYNAILSLGEGPVHKLMGRTTDTDPDMPLRSGDATNPIPPGWLFVNDGDAADLEDCEVHVRLGSLEQEAIPGFAFTTQTSEVDADIEGPAANYATFTDRTYGEPVFASGNRNPVLAADGVTSSDGLWAEYGTAFSMTDEADEFSITIEWPTGLGKTAPDGFPLPWYWALAIRYIELDGGGSPITTGGSEGDGYVRPPAVPSNLARYSPGQRVDARFPFYDPQTYVRPSFSRTLRINPSGSAFTNYVRNADFRPYQLALDETTMDAFSFECWVCLRPTDPTQPTDDNDVLTTADLSSAATIFSWYSTSALRKGGFTLQVQNRTVTIAPGQTRQRLIPVFNTVDTAGAVTAHYERKGELGDVTFQVNLQRRSVPDSDFFHVVGTYKKNVLGAQDRVRLFANGEMVYEAVGNWNVGYPMTSSSVGVEARMGYDVAGANPLKGWLDNAVLWAGEMAADDVRLAFNGGQGRTLPAGDTAYTDELGATRLLTQGVWTFDAFEAPGDGLGGGEVVPDSTTFSLDFVTVMAGGSPTSQIALGTASDQGFIGVASATNTRKRGRYRVEVMRGLKLFDGAVIQDAMRWVALELHTDELYTYPSSPLLGVRIRADGEINGRAPNLKTLGEWRLLPEWDGASTAHPTFTRRWSRNPAWVCIDAAIDPVCGIPWVFSADDIVVESWQEFADFCDEVVYDQRGRRMEHPDWSDMLYSSVLLGTEAGISVRVPTGTAPRHWVVGGYLGWYGLPAITAVGSFEDTNVEATGGGGYEIVSISRNPGGSGLDFFNVRWEGALPPWTNGALLSTQITDPMAGTVEGREPRFLCDEVPDQAGSAWDFIVGVCAAARAVPIRDGRRLRVRVERPRPLRGILGHAQVIPGTFEYEPLSPKTATNAIDIMFPDVDRGYERSPAQDEHPSVRGTSALSQIRRRAYSLEGVTRRSQVLRHARYMLNRQHLVRRRGRVRCSVDQLEFEPGDVIQIAHDVADRGTGGRVLEQVDSTHLLLDRALTLVSGKTYRLAIRFASAPPGEGPQIVDVDDGATGLGTKKGWEGDEIVLADALARDAQKGDTFIWYEVGRELTVCVDSITLTRDLQREVAFSQYDEDVFLVEGRDDLADVDTESVVGEAPARGVESVPLPPESIRARELTTLSSSGTAEHSVEVRWERSAASVGVAGYDVFVGGRGAWVRAVSVGAGADRAVLTVPGARLGLVVAVSVVARSPSGRSRGPDGGTRASVRMLNRPLAPLGPTTFSAAVAHELATYSFNPGDTSETTTHEARVGGWVLGQPWFVAPAGARAFGPTSCWASSAPLTSGSRPTVPIFLRARSRANAWSAARLLEWTPRPLDYTAIGEGYVNAFWSQSWEEFEDGWVDDGPGFPNAALSNLERLADGSLGFSGSALSGTYTTAPPIISVDAKPEHVHVSAFVEAEQIHPLTWDDLTFAWDDPTSCWTWEGPIDSVQDGEDVGSCTIAIEMRTADQAGAWGIWQDYRPGRARCVAAQFRITVTRPSTAFDVRIRRFSVDLLRVPRTRWERSPAQIHAEARVLHRG